MIRGSLYNKNLTTKQLIHISHSEDYFFSSCEITFYKKKYINKFDTTIITLVYDETLTEDKRKHYFKKLRYYELILDFFESIQ
jgi:hypothetical protein